MPDNKNKDDLSFDDILSENDDFKNLFDDADHQDETKKQKQVKAEISSIAESEFLPTEDIQTKKRSATDFEPNMDALFITAQSSMIIDGFEYLNNKKFIPESLAVYIEALKGVNFYIKMLDRNPNNYKKLKNLISADPDCLQVEKITFEEFKKERGSMPDSDKEKVEAFELTQRLFKEAINKVNINRSIRILKKYFLISGEVDIEKVSKLNSELSVEFKNDINTINQNLKAALLLTKKGNYELTEGLRGKDLNNFIVKATAIIGYYCQIQNKPTLADHFYRIHNLHKKYFLMK